MQSPQKSFCMYEINNSNNNLVFVRSNCKENLNQAHQEQWWFPSTSSPHFHCPISFHHLLCAALFFLCGGLHWKMCIGTMTRISYFFTRISSWCLSLQLQISSFRIGSFKLLDVYGSSLPVTWFICSSHCIVEFRSNNCKHNYVPSSKVHLLQKLSVCKWHFWVSNGMYTVPIPRISRNLWSDYAGERVLQMHVNVNL